MQTHLDLGLEVLIWTGATGLGEILELTVCFLRAGFLFDQMGFQMTVEDYRVSESATTALTTFTQLIEI